jgi:hypothetical protein
MKSLFGLILSLTILGGGNIASAATYPPSEGGPVPAYGPVTVNSRLIDGAATPVNEYNLSTFQNGDSNVNQIPGPPTNFTEFDATAQWEEIAKIDGLRGGNSYSKDGLSFATQTDLKSGSWSILSSLWQTYKAITLILKDGGTDVNGVKNVKYTAWLLTENSLAGNWFMSEKQLSYMALYGTEENISGDEPPSTVPVPAAVWLFGSGLLGLLGAARRKSAAA